LTGQTDHGQPARGVKALVRLGGCASSMQTFSRGRARPSGPAPPPVA